MGDYKIEDIYQGNYSSLKPTYGNFTGYRSDAGSLGLTTDPRTANFLNEVSSKIPAGGKVFEVAAVNAEMFESVPKQQLEEIKRLTKLTGTEVTLHAPIVEPSGITKEGYSETFRESAERQMNLAVERGHEMDAKGNINVTFHSSAIIPMPEIQKVKGEKEIQKELVINSETGQIASAQKETKFYPSHREDGKVKEEFYDIQRQINTMNSSEWDNAISQLLFNKDRADQIISQVYPVPKDVYVGLAKGDVKFDDLSSEQRESILQVQTAHEYLKDVQMHLEGLYNKAYKNFQNNGKKEELRKLEEFSKEFAEEVNTPDVQGQSRALQHLMVKLKKVTPETYASLNDFAKNKSSETFANVALNSYKKFKDDAPIISIENPPVGGAFSTGDELKQIVEESRKKFVEKAVEKGILDKKQAEKQAKKLLGVTWDVGHINMLRKHGFDSKDIIKETEAVAPLVKHVHLSDNFGFEHTELPMGMGNVPLKEMMAKLGEKGFEGKKIIEAANWWQHMKTPPIAASLEAMGSPIYSMQMQPYWNQSVGLQQGYFSGYGQMLPQMNYETFGAGFSNLPAELGGQRQGAGSRLSGRGME